MSAKNVNEKLKCSRSVMKEFADHRVRKGKEEQKVLHKEVQLCINGKRIFTPLSTMHTSGAVLEHSGCV